jgi:hypothetical protein
MTYEEIKKIVTHEDTKRYRVRLADGKTKVVRLWSNYGVPCIIGKGRRHYGHELSAWCDKYNEWVSLALVERKERDVYSTFMKRAKDAVKMLGESGLWRDIKENIEHFLSLSEEKRRELVSDIMEDSYEKFYKETYGDGKYNWVTCHQIYESFASKRCWKSVAWDRWERQRMTESIQTAITNKEEFTKRWTNGYDNTLELSFKGGYPRGWYSSEYRNCANGHYYLLFDATHAIFYEDD